MGGSANVPKIVSLTRTWIANITNIFRNANVLRTSRIYTAMRMYCKHIQDAAVALLMRRVSIASAKRIYNPRCSAEVPSIYKLIVMLLDGSNTRGLGWAESEYLPQLQVYIPPREGLDPFIGPLRLPQTELNCRIYTVFGVLQVSSLPVSNYQWIAENMRKRVNYKQEMSLKKTNGVGLKNRRKYNTRLSTCT